MQNNDIYQPLEDQDKIPVSGGGISFMPSKELARELGLFALGSNSVPYGPPVIVGKRRSDEPFDAYSRASSIRLHDLRSNIFDVHIQSLADINPPDDSYSNQKDVRKRVFDINVGSPWDAQEMQVEARRLREAISHLPASPLPEESVAQLQARIRFLEAQLRADLPYLQIYKFGGTSVLVAIVSLAAWAITGIGVPFHPVFAAMAVPVAIGVMVMAFFLRREANSPAP